MQAVTLTHLPIYSQRTLSLPPVVFCFQGVEKKCIGNIWFKIECANDI